MSKKSISAKMRRNGTLVRVKGDGTEEPMLVPPLTPRTNREIEAAALADPDAQPLRESDVKRMRRVPRVKTLRRALGFTQEEFAARYQIPIGTLRDWEQGRTEPDQPARAYLKVIAHDAAHVHRILRAADRNNGF
jgi:putative transcriptional regulator